MLVDADLMGGIINGDGKIIIPLEYDRTSFSIYRDLLCFINQNGQRRIIKLQDYHLDKLDYQSIDYLYGNYYKKVEKL